jgi:hypothetical protein
MLRRNGAGLKQQSTSIKKYPNLCIKQPLISDWLKNKTKWWEQWAKAEQQGRSGAAKRLKQVDDILELWIAKAMCDRVHLSGELIQHKWTHFTDLVGIPEEERLALNEGWLGSLKKHCGLKELKWHREAESAHYSTG